MTAPELQRRVDQRVAEADLALSLADTTVAQSRARIAATRERLLSCPAEPARHGTDTRHPDDRRLSESKD